jgi:helix-turn-helix protein
VPDHPARRLWVALETLHDVTYFAEGVRPAGIALGLRGFWMT